MNLAVPKKNVKTLPQQLPEERQVLPGPAESCYKVHLRNNQHLNSFEPEDGNKSTNSHLLSITQTGFQIVLTVESLLFPRGHILNFSRLAWDQKPVYPLGGFSIHPLQLD